MSRSRRVKWVTTFLALCLVATACGGDDSSGADGPGGGSGTIPDDAELDLDATVRVADLLVPQQLDPHLERNSRERPYTFLLYDRLFMLDSENQIVPGLAEDWEYSDDGLQLTLSLRDDATFSDGSPITGEAVRVSLERAQDLEGSTVAGRLAALESIDVVDDHTVVLNLNEPDITLVQNLTMSSGIILNPVALEDPDVDLGSGPDGAGSGAYELTSFVPGESITFTRSDRDYWDEDAAKVRVIEITQVDPQAGVNGIQTGQFDAVYARVPMNVVEQAAASADLDLDLPVSDILTSLWLRNTRGDLQSLEVRRAIAHAVDWQVIAENVIGDRCIPSPQHVKEGAPGWIPDAEPYRYDVDEARRLLEEAGGPPKSFEVIVGDLQAEHRAAATAIQDQLAEIGITMDIRVVPAAELFPLYRNLEADAMMNTMSFEPSTQLRMQQTFVSNFAQAGPQLPEFEPLYLRTVDPTLSDDEREDALQEAAQFALDQAWNIPICFATLRWLSTPNILGMDTLPWASAGLFDFRYIAVAAS